MLLELRTRSRPLSRLSGAFLVVSAVLALLSANATASHRQLQFFQDDSAIQSNPLGTLQELQQLGVQELRLSVSWQRVAPSAGSRRRPRRFNAANPAAYPARNWRIFDTIISEAPHYGIGIDLDALGGAPRWAEGPGVQRGAVHNQWNPSAGQFGLFVRALGTRYSGHYTPAGASGPLPRVHFWTIWNEPNYGPSLAPQGVYPKHLTVENSPRMYRNLVDAGWSALHRSGHGGDTFAFGEMAPRGAPNAWGVFSGMKPLTFLRAMYCVDSRYRQLRGSAAALRGCPTNAGGARRFRSAHPALFSASGVSDHMYMRWYSPNRERHNDRNFASLGDVGQLTRSLDRLQRAYHSGKRFTVYDTEFGYITSPPKRTNQYPWVSTSTAALYINWAEYLSWRNPRIGSYHQFLLRDPLPSNYPGDPGGFASGLRFYGGREKADYAAYRLPLFMPTLRTRRGHSLEVWGCVRPAHDASVSTGLPQSVQIQFAPSGSRTFTTISVLPITDPGGYIDTHVVFPRSGTVILKWSYPSGTAISSRHVHITIH